MYKNQLQELAQRSCFNLPSYTCFREGPDHAPRFKASVNFNGEVFDAPTYCTTLRQAEHAAAEVALNTLSTRGPSRFLAAKVLDEIGVYKNLLQESVHKAGLTLPVYSTERSGPGHLPVFVSIVELAGLNFTGEFARTKKQAEKNAAMAAWSALKQLSNVKATTSQTSKGAESSEEQEHVVVAKVLSDFKPKGENKTSRQRYTNEAMKKVVSKYGKDDDSGSSFSRAFLQQQQQQQQQQQLRWRMPSSLFSNVSIICPTQPNQQQKDNSTALLNPVTSKILPPTYSTDETNHSLYPSNKGVQIQVRSNSQGKCQDIPPPVEEHQKDEDEWLNGGVETKEKSIENSSNSAYSKSVFRPIICNSRMPPSNANTAPSPRILTSGGSSFHAHRVAPPVHIRSVIPVCAAPPPRRPPTLSSPVTAPGNKQDISSVSDSSVFKKTEQEVQEVQKTTLKK